jgi:hypothetical protein
MPHNIDNIYIDHHPIISLGVSKKLGLPGTEKMTPRKYGDFSPLVC